MCKVDKKLEKQLSNFETSTPEELIKTIVWSFDHTHLQVAFTRITL